MPFIYQPRRPRASPLWQLVRHGWDVFLAHYEGKYRKSLGPLHPAATATVESFLRCGDLASGFTRLQCPDCGHERLLAWYGGFESESAAIDFERYLKTASGKAFARKRLLHT